jgi:hypothetical protein
MDMRGPFAIFFGNPGREPGVYRSALSSALTQPKTAIMLLQCLHGPIAFNIDS